MMTNQFLIILIASLAEIVLHCRSKADTYLTASVGDTVTLPCFSNYSDPADWKFRSRDDDVEHRVSSRGKTVNGYRCSFNLDANKNQGKFSLTIADVQKGDAGRYRCVEDGEFGPTQYVHLNVSGIRHIYARRDTKVTRVGCRVWLGCYSSLQYSTVGWNRRTTEGHKRNSTRLRVDTVTDGVREFVVKRANLSDSGTYTCVDRQDRRDKTLRQVDLFVVADESDVTEILATVGNTLNLTCHKKQQSIVQWKHKYLPWQIAKGVNPSGKYQVFNDHETSVLRISEVANSDSGLYVCSESYDLEPSRSTGSFVVSVRSSCITTCPRDVVAVSGSDVILSASTINANDDCHWGRFNDSSRVPNNIFAEGILQDVRYDVIDYRSGQLDLAIKNVSVEDAGTYMFKDDLCNENTTVRLIVLQRSPTCKLIEVKDARSVHECVVNFRGNVQMKVTCHEENVTHQLNVTLNLIPGGYSWRLPVRSSVRCVLSADIFACEKRVSEWSFDIIITTDAIARATGFSNASIGLGTTAFVIIVLAVVIGVKRLVTKIRTRRKQRKQQKQPSMLPQPDSSSSHGDCRTLETKSSDRFLADYGKDKEADGDNGTRNTQDLWHLNNPQQHSNRDLKSNDYLVIPASPQKSSIINDSSDTFGYVNMPGGRGTGCPSAENPM